MMVFRQAEKYRKASTSESKTYRSLKYARGSHIGFLSTSQTRSCALRMPRYVTFTNPTKRTQEIQTVKRTPFTDKFPANQLFARTIFSFLSFYVNIYFYNILNHVGFLSSYRRRNIVTV